MEKKSGTFWRACGREAGSDITLVEPRSLPCTHGRELLPHSLSGKDEALTILADPTDKSCCVDAAGSQHAPVCVCECVCMCVRYRLGHLYSLSDNPSGSTVILPHYQTPHLREGGYLE